VIALANPILSVVNMSKLIEKRAAQVRALVAG